MEKNKSYIAAVEESISKAGKWKEALEQIENQLYSINANNISMRWIGMRQGPTMDDIYNLNKMLGFIIHEMRKLRETGELDIPKLLKEHFEGATLNQEGN